MRSLVYLLVIVFIVMLVAGNVPAYRTYTPQFAGANIVWVILIILLVLYLLRWLPGF